jgi:hypothetical protein
MIISNDIDRLMNENDHSTSLDRIMTENYHFR